MWRGSRHIFIDDARSGVLRAFAARSAASAPLCKGSRERAQSPRCSPQQLRPPLAGGPHPSRCSAQGAAPRHLPQGGRLSTPSPLCRPAIKMCRHGRHTLTFRPLGEIFHARKARISPPQSSDFTRRLCRRISLRRKAAHGAAAHGCAAPRRLARLYAFGSSVSSKM